MGRAAPIGALCLPLVTNLSGELMEPGTVLDAHHWRDHLREPVQFTTGLKTIAEQGHSLFLEVGPNPTLLGLAKVCLGHDAGVWLPSLIEGQDDVQVLLNSLATLLVRGVSVCWERLERGDPRRRVPLPTYPFQRQRCWFETQQRPPSIPTQQLHPLLGTQEELASGELVCTKQFNCSEQPWLSDHRVFERVVVAPGVLYLSMALATAALPPGSVIRCEHPTSHGAGRGGPSVIDKCNWCCSPSARRGSKTSNCSASRSPRKTVGMLHGRVGGSSVDAARP